MLRLAGTLATSRHAPEIGFIPQVSTEELAIAALRAGIKGYWATRPTIGDLIDFVETAWMRSAGRAKPCDATGMVAHDTAMKAIREQLDRLAPLRATTLITGETGTGKEVVAEYLHTASGRRGPLVAVNCAALPEALAESELFGYERGAFTGASQARVGQIGAANGGTLLLDEIGDMPLSLQAKLLRTLEKKSLQRLGATRPTPIDVRFLAATNRSLQQLMQQGKFREDLYYRLSVAHIHIPPLRERTDAIEPLSMHFIDQMNAEYGLSVEGFTPEALGCLLGHSWPGNVRELRNLIERLMVSVNSGHIGVEHLPAGMGASRSCLEDLKRAEILSALRKTGWNKSEAARKLRWSRMTLYRKIAKYHIA